MTQPAGFTKGSQLCVQQKVACVATSLVKLVEFQVSWQL
ncbi:hypothetical protein PPEP_b1064 [Pseudoalteromonas peptidolytica F12-50-A1]|uniref:Uncharacterized protein n=1 Tax=Pseudoalteromonas peptidolytica F12-50-A1 TaxID=1315280 RepID=A0A8I0N1A5_9GAMM|nr:hypothetical protein [Pseudoalteromonas peptidolytica F12-50-A1]